MRYELYYDADGMVGGPVTEDFDPLKIWSLLSRLKEERAIDFKIIDVSQWSSELLNKVYEAAITASVWNRYRIRKVFGTNASSASFFGRGVPALLVFEGDRPVHVFPHEEPTGLVTIRAHLDKLLCGDAGGAELMRKMDELRRAIGPIGRTTSELVREGRHR